MATEEEIARARAYLDAKFSPAGMLGGGTAPPLVMPTVEMADPAPPPPPAALPLGGGLTYSAPAAPPPMLRPAPSPGALSPALIDAARARLGPTPPAAPTGPGKGPTPEAIQAARARLGGGGPAEQAYPAAAEALRGAYAEAGDAVTTPEPLRNARGELTRAYGEALDSVVPEEEKARRAIAGAYDTAASTVARIPRPSVGSRIREDERDLLGTYDSEREAVGKARDAETALALDRSRRTEEMAAFTAKKAAEEEDIARATDAELTRYRAESTKLADQVRNKKIDPERLYGNMDAGTRIAYGIMGAIGGLYQAMRGGENPFLAQLNRNIDRDIAAQQHDLDTEKGLLEQRNTAYAQLRTAHGDARLARDQTKNLMLDAAKMQLEAEAAKIGTPVAEARAQQQIAAIDKQQAELRRNIDVGEQQQAQRAAMAEAAARAAAEEKRFQRWLQLEDRRLKEKQIDLEHGDGANKPNNKESRFVATGTAPDGAVEGYLARNAEVAQKRTNALASAKKAITLIDNILEIREQQGKLGRATSRNEGSILGTPEWKTRVSALHGDLKVEAKNVKELGAITKQDEPLIGSIIGPSATDMDLFSDDTGTRLRQARESFQRAVDAEGSQEGGTRVRKRVDEQGRAHFEVHGLNAPTNRRAVQRFDAAGNPVK